MSASIYVIVKIADAPYPDFRNSTFVGVGLGLGRTVYMAEKLDRYDGFHYRVYELDGSTKDVDNMEKVKYVLTHGKYIWSG